MINIIEFIEEHKMDGVPGDIKVSEICKMIETYGNSAFDLLNAGFVVGYYKAKGELKTSTAHKVKKSGQDQRF